MFYCHADPHADLNAIKPTNKLNSSLAIYRSRMGGTIKRKQPSREHLQKMRSAGDLMDKIPKDLLSNLDKPLEDSTPSPRHSNKSSPRSASEEAKEPPVPQPKPKPRAAPRKKPQPLPPSADEGKDTKKPPQAAPRVRTQTIDISELTKVSSEGKGSTEKVVKDKEDVVKADSSPKHPMAGSGGSEMVTPSPKLSRPPNVGRKPATKREGTGKPPAKEPTDAQSSPVRDVLEDHTSPTRSRTSSEEKEPHSSESATKDPSKLSVKEKAMLAQKALMSTPERHKPGPPIPRKPKPTPTSGSTENIRESTPTDDRLKRAQSMDDEIGSSPQLQRRKLPPGAFNMMMMGGVSMFGPPSHGRSAERQTHPHAEEDGVDEADNGEDPSNAGDKLESSLDDVRGDSDTRISPASTPPTSTRVRHQDSDFIESSTAEDSPPEPRSSAGVDYEVVLTWTPDVTASWLEQVGLGSYQQAFVEKGIHGYMLFDMDGHRLKVMCSLPIDSSRWLSPFIKSG